MGQQTTHENLQSTTRTIGIWTFHFDVIHPLPYLPISSMSMASPNFGITAI